MIGELELKTLMLASCDCDVVSYRKLLDLLSPRLRASTAVNWHVLDAASRRPKGPVQDALLAIRLKRHTYDAARPLTGAC